MNITELINYLLETKAKHGDLPVLVSGYEGDYQERILTTVMQVYSHREDYFGSHASADDREPGDPVAFKVIVLERGA